MDQALKSALLGTARAPDWVPDADDRLAELIPPQSELAAEERLLLHAGLSAVARQAGYRPHTVPSISPAPSETGHVANRELTRLLRQALCPETLDLLQEFLPAMHRAGVVFPAELLPDILNMTDANRRELVRPVLGRRGEWLAEMNPDWAWALPDQQNLGDETPTLRQRWDEGTLAERCEVLRRMREIDPATARNWLESELAQEKAEHRRRLIDVLRETVTTDDLTLLESLQSDRSSRVRGLVLELLTHIPSSRFAQRLREWRANAIQLRPDDLPRLDVQVPDVADDAEFALLAGSPPRGVGQRAWQLRQLVAFIPPAFWTAHSHGTPRDWVRAAQQHDMGDEILFGWQSALQRYAGGDPGSHEWIQAVLDSLVVQLAREPVRDDLREQAQALLPLFPAGERDGVIIGLLKRVKRLPVEHFVSLVKCLEVPWSPALSVAYLEYSRQLWGQVEPRESVAWSQSLLPAAMGIHPDQFEAALRPWSIVPSSGSAYSVSQLEGRLRLFGEVIRVRQKFYQELKRSQQR